MVHCVVTRLREEMLYIILKLISLRHQILPASCPRSHQLSWVDFPDNRIEQNKNINANEEHYSKFYVRSMLSEGKIVQVSIQFTVQQYTHVPGKSPFNKFILGTGTTVLRTAIKCSW